jgi:hypothetical protein
VRRTKVLVAYVCLGLLNTWLSLLLVSKLSFDFLPTFVESSGSCGDYGQCEVSVWTHITFFSLLLLPLVIHFAFGYAAGKSPNKLLNNHVRASLALSFGTLLFYVCARALRGA